MDKPTQTAKKVIEKCVLRSRTCGDLPAPPREKVLACVTGGEHMHEIIPGVFIGDQESAGMPDIKPIDKESHKKCLKSLNITHICVCGAYEFDPRVYPDDFEYLVLSPPLTDSAHAKLDVYFDTTEHFIDSALKKGGSVLVHCFAGASRSASIVIAYLMRTRNWSYEYALTYVRYKRAVVEPNFNFELQLLALEQTLQDPLFGIHCPSSSSATAESDEDSTSVFDCLRLAESLPRSLNA